jgi:hypothetical protein
MENNRIAVLNHKHEVLSTESYPTADAAYEAYTDAIRVLKKHLTKGEKVTVCRIRWGQVMAFEDVVGTH